MVGCMVCVVFFDDGGLLLVVVGVMFDVSVDVIGIE